MPSARSLLVATLCGATGTALARENGGHYHDQMQAKAIARRDAATTSNPPKCIYDRPWQPKNNPSVMVFLYHAGCPANPKDAWPIAIDPVTKQCTDSFFVDLAKGCKSVMAVLNPCRGPYSDNHPNLEAMQICTKMLSDAGVEMVGYTHTKVTGMNSEGIWTPVGFESLPSIFATMDQWTKQMKFIPNFKGFFLDDTTNHIDTKNMKWGVNHTEKYVEIVNYAHKLLPEATIVLNPGVFPDMSLLTPAPGYPIPAQISIPFENFAWRWKPDDTGSCAKSMWTTKKGQFGVGPWCPFVPEYDELETFKAAVEAGKTIAAGAVHTATREFAFTQAKVAFDAKLKYFYATDRNLTNDPWKGLPSFWEDYLKMLADGEDPLPTNQSTTTPTGTPSADNQQVQQGSPSSASSAGIFAPTLGAMLLAVLAPLVANVVY
eukprot:comp20555_c1_seq1/m.26392 comp20555_c1_seq1/g.26392  ORF comp20555_c1_seq1/g.26392 comp20555_c1_seq1/m.26392 type:complete len:432 (-) comp20555_c1_seq1:153-1448(-)